MKLSNPHLLPSPKGKTYAIANPASGKVIAEVTDSGKKATQKAIEAAEQALPAWRAKTAADRATIPNHRAGKAADGSCW